jgi:hypothetical protein
MFILYFLSLTLQKIVLYLYFVAINSLYLSFVDTPENSSLSTLRYNKFIVFSFVDTPENSSLSTLRYNKFIVFSFVETP